MIILIYGKDNYRSQEKLKEIIGHYQKIHSSGLNLKYFDFSSALGKKENKGFKDLINQASQFSMFSEKKLIVIEGAFSAPFDLFSDIKDLSESKDIILVFYEREDIDLKSSLFSLLKDISKIQDFKLLSGSKLKSWYQKELKKFQIKQDFSEKLIELVGNDLWRATNEIQKIANFSNGDEITTKDIDNLIRSKIDTDIFKTIDALAQRNKKQALEFLHKHFQKGDSALYLLSMINFQFRNLYLLKARYGDYNFLSSSAVAKEMKIHPFVAQKTINQSKRFSFEQLKKIYQKIFQVDFDIKTGQISPEAGLDMLIAEI